jgi:hypothetical protein
MRIFLLMPALVLLSACAQQYPEIEAKASKICTDAGLIADTHSTPYRCYIADGDPRLIK